MTDAQRTKDLAMIRDDAVWTNAASRIAETQRIREHDATVAALKSNPAFAALFDPAKWQELH